MLITLHPRECNLLISFAISTAASVSPIAYALQNMAKKNLIPTHTANHAIIDSEFCIPLFSIVKRRFLATAGTNNDKADASDAKAPIINDITQTTKKGKNFYADVDDCIITINSSSYTIITAHKKK